MSFRELPFTKNRQLISDMLTRARRFHAPVTGSLELDVTDTRARLRAETREGSRVGLVPYLVCATARVVRAHPVLKRHLFTTWYGRKREIEFDSISCTLIVARKSKDGESILFPLVIRDVDRLSIGEIAAIIADHRDRPIEELPQFQAMERIKRLPGLALTWVSYKARSDPRFYLEHFGTYGLSSLIDVGGAMNAMAVDANTAIAFLPSSLKKRPWVHQGKVVPREILNVSLVVDHNLVDGGESLRISHTVRDLIEKPERVLGPALAARRAGTASG
jgi:pyruvate/2-oxoglutarate dehydrogenase complex dihydrolipoamide acyltransferase (E2) component